MKMNSIVMLQLRNWHSVKENTGQFTMHGTVFSFILHNSLLLNENEFLVPIRDWILLTNSSVMFCDLIFCQ